MTQYAPKPGADQIRPILDRVLVRIDKAKIGLTKTEGGLYIPEDVRHTEQCIGTVVAVGPGKRWDVAPHKDKFIPTYVRPGDRVLFALEGAEPLTWLDTDEYHYEMLLSEIHILGTL